MSVLLLRLWLIWVMSGHFFGVKTTIFNSSLMSEMQKKEINPNHNFSCLHWMKMISAPPNDLGGKTTFFPHYFALSLNWVKIWEVSEVVIFGGVHPSWTSRRHLLHLVAGLQLHRGLGVACACFWPFGRHVRFRLSVPSPPTYQEHRRLEYW